VRKSLFSHNVIQTAIRSLSVYLIKKATLRWPLFSRSVLLCPWLFCGPEPYGRWQLPFSCGNHVPSYGAAFSAGMYEASSAPPFALEGDGWVAETHPQPDSLVLYTILSTKVKAIFPICTVFSEKIFPLVVGKMGVYKMLWLAVSADRAGGTSRTSSPTDSIRPGAKP